MADAPKVEIKPKGDRVVLEIPAAAVPGLKPHAPWQIVAASSDAVVVGRGAPVFAGSLEVISVGELIGLLLSGVRTGKLHLTHGASRRMISFRDGQVVFASSTEPHERLGRTLIREGLISEQDLERALAKVGPGSRVGQVLTREKLISAADLYAALGRLVKQIVVGAFELTEGGFLFVEGPAPSDDALKLPVRTRELLLEGLQRGEEVVRLRRELPVHLEVVPGPTAGRERLEQAAREQVNDGAPLYSLRRLRGDGELDFLRWASKLLEDGVLVRRERGEEAFEAAQAPKGPVELYAQLVRTICQAMRNAGQDLAPLRGFFANPGPGLEGTFEGVTLSDEGELDVAKVLQNVSGQDAALARAMAYEALDAFASYALFSAKNVLPAELAALLQDELRRVSEGR